MVSFSCFQGMLPPQLLNSMAYFFLNEPVHIQPNVMLTKHTGLLV